VNGALRSEEMSLENKDSCNLNPILSELVRNSGALTAMIITKEGLSIDEAGDTSYLNVTAMAALVAGMFSATREVARLVGEEKFSILLQQGETRHIHISLIHDSKMMVIIFEDYKRIGLVRHEARKAGESLSRVLEQPESQEKADEISSPQFKEYALNLIDRIFETK
jgi:predicted regulator of Ras-like GTPase activity (Roadblock/LC7/MglB family)